MRLISKLKNERFSAATKEADVYSFGLVCCEVVNRKPVWELNTNNSNDPDGLQTAKMRLEDARVSEILYILSECGLCTFLVLNVQPSIQSTANIFAL